MATRNYFDVVPSDIIVIFEVTTDRSLPEAALVGGFSKSYLLLRIFVERPLHDLEYLRTLIVRRLPELRSAFIHEFTHYLDRRSMGRGAWRKAVQYGKGVDEFGNPIDATERAYFKDPTEQNAFFQQTADLIEQELTAEQITAMDVNEFYRFFVKKMDELTRGAAPHWYRQRQIPGLKKRVAQLWNSYRSTS